MTIWTLRGSIDRIEEEVAVLLLEDGGELEMRVEALPEGQRREGARVRVRVQLLDVEADVEAEAAGKARLAALQARLGGKDPGGDLDLGDP